MRKRKLADSEWTILSAMWDAPPMTMREIVKRVSEQSPEVGWGYKTYHTYLRNMCDKGLLSFETINRKDKLYSANITRDEALDGETSSIMSRAGYFGSPSRMMAALVSHHDLTDDDRRELMRLVSELESKLERGDQR